MSAVPDADPDSDRALLERHVRGDADAFGRLFARHRDRLWAVALRTTGDPDEAADALQDAMIAAFRRAESFRGDAAVTTWLHRIVVNACLDRLRRRQVRLAEPLPDDRDQRAGAGPEDPADAAERDERRAQVLRALAELPPDQRAALVLVDMQGYRVDEAAAVLDVAPGTVKSRCSRGRARLAVALAGLRPGNAGSASSVQATPPHPGPRSGPVEGGRS